MEAEDELIGPNYPMGRPDHMGSQMSECAQISKVAYRNERLILLFHGLGSVPGSITSEERDYWCDEDRFTSILNCLPTLTQVIQIELTFDDGNISDAVIALPALLRHGLKATFFVCSGRIGLPGYLDGPALKDIISAGMEVGSHGWGHVDWRKVDERTLDLEINGSRKKLGEIIGYAVEKVAVPFGSYDRRIVNRLRRSRIRTVYTSDGGRAPLTGWMLPREDFNTSWDENRTLIKLATSPIPMDARIARLIRGAIKRLR
jgi:hypothetical protein